jgi:hypothetical protein
VFKQYQVEIELIEKLLGTQPTEPKAREFLKEVFPEKEDEEVPLAGGVSAEGVVPEVPKQTFYTHDDRPVLMDYQLKGFFKEAAVTLPEHLGVAGRKSEFPSSGTIKGYIDRWLFIAPRHIDLLNASGLRKDKVDGSMVHYLRGMTRRGERVAPLDSDYMDEGTRMKFIVSVLKTCSITDDGVKEWLKYGEEGLGLLGWRTAGYGRFKVVNFEALPLPEKKG